MPMIYGNYQRAYLTKEEYIAGDDEHPCAEPLRQTREREIEVVK